MDDTMTGPRPTTFVESLDTLRSAAFVHGEAAAKGNDRACAKARKLADRAHGMALDLYAHEADHAKNAPPWVFGGDGTTTLAALVDRLIEASSYANLVHVIAPNDEGGPRELAAARQAIFTAFDVAVRTADADGYARAMGGGGRGVRVAVRLRRRRAKSDDREDQFRPPVAMARLAGG